MLAAEREISDQAEEIARQTIEPQNAPLTWADAEDSATAQARRKLSHDGQPTLVPPSAIRRTALRKTSISSRVL